MTRPVVATARDHIEHNAAVWARSSSTHSGHTRDTAAACPVCAKWAAAIHHHEQGIARCPACATLAPSICGRPDCPVCAHRQETTR